MANITTQRFLFLIDSNNFDFAKGDYGTICISGLKGNFKLIISKAKSTAILSSEIIQLNFLKEKKLVHSS